MRISYFELKNYRRFKELKLQFPDGIIGILGLNGVGKTTVIEAIAWALFGNVDEVVRTSRESVRRSTAGQNEVCSALLEFELGGQEYRIVREMGGKSLTMRADLSCKEKRLAEGDKPVRNMVEKLIGMDHKSFFTSVFARQKELNALQNVAAGERKKVVLRMLRIDGVDTVLTLVRADRKDALSRIEGAEKTLITEDGRERQKVLTERIPELDTIFETASKELTTVEEREKLATVEFEAVKKRRDELKKDVDAYNSSASDLKAKQTQIGEMRKREKSISTRITETNTKLTRLPQLEKEEHSWQETSQKKEAHDREKAKYDKARMIQQEIASDEREEARRLEELAKARTSVGSVQDVVSRIDEVEKAKSDCQTQAAQISGRIGELRAVMAERREASNKDQKKLEEIRAAGKQGLCPTCERTLEDAYELLVNKLTGSASDAQKAAAEASTSINSLEAERKALTSRLEALGKKRLTLDQELKKMNQLETTVQGMESELGKVRIRLAQRKKALVELGEIKFSDAEQERLAKEHARLKQVHDEFLEIRSLKAQTEHYARDLEDAQNAIAKGIGEEEQFKSIVETLEPKKNMYDLTIKELDEKTVKLNSIKDTVRKLSTSKDRAHSELERARKEIAEIARVRKTIEKDRKAAEELALLEDIVVNFKDHLIGRIAPVLSELTSKGLESMTEGKYTRVELDENYEMQIDDQGTSYPIDRFSGGESDLANLSLRLAISRIIADRTGATPINFLILDEIFGSQDPNRKRSVMTALSHLSSQFRQIFLITHIEDIKDSMNYVIRVEEQEDGTSKAELTS
jgi:exonuclease SbcC